MNEKKEISNKNFKEIKKAKNSVIKALKFLDQEPDFKNLFGFNNLLNQPVFLKNTPWRECRSKDNGEIWQDKDTFLLIDYANRYNLHLSRKSLEEAINIKAYKNEFCPVQNYLKSLPEWDRVPRVASIFSDYLGVEDNSYTREVAQVFLMAMVKRIFEPGCKFDHMIVLQGSQGIGKSSFLQILGGEWFSDSLNKFSDKEAIEQISGAWLVEIAELQGFNKADINALKAFISRLKDVSRMAYGRFNSYFPRKCVLAGTTNSDDYLRDPTGNRRFFPLICNEPLNFDKLRKNRDQILAEAYYYYQDYLIPFCQNPLSVFLTLITPEAKLLAEEARQQAEYIDPWQDVITQYLAKPLPPDYWERKPFPNSEGEPYTAEEEITRDRVATLELCTECLGISQDKINRAITIRISGIMQKLGWVKTRLRFGSRYGNAKGYKRPEQKLG